MNHQHDSTDPPSKLAARLTLLNDNLQALGERLKASIATLVSETIAETVRDAIRCLLRIRVADTPSPSHRDYRDYRERCYPHAYREPGDDSWSEDERRWSEAEQCPWKQRRAAERNDSPPRWGNALSAAVQTALWFAKQQPRRRPMLTTLAVTFAAGLTAFVAGPVCAAGAGVLASVASLVLTADATKSAAELAAG
jgi:hypothetical protein